MNLHRMLIGGNSTGSKRNKRSKQHTKHQDPTEYNIFCSDMVGLDFVLRKLEEVKASTKVTRLEMEDLLDEGQQHLEIFPRLKSLLLTSDRTWASVRFLDTFPLEHYLDWYTCKEGILKEYQYQDTALISWEKLMEWKASIEIRCGTPVEDMLHLFKAVKQDKHVCHVELRLDVMNSTKGTPEEMVDLIHWAFTDQRGDTNDDTCREGTITKTIFVDIHCGWEMEEKKQTDLKLLLNKSIFLLKCAGLEKIATPLATTSTTNNNNARVLTPAASVRVPRRQAAPTGVPSMDSSLRYNATGRPKTLSSRNLKQSKSCDLLASTKSNVKTSPTSKANFEWKVQKPAAAGPGKRAVGVAGAGGPRPAIKPISRCKSAQLILLSKISTATSQGSNANFEWKVEKPAATGPGKRAVAVAGARGPRPAIKPISRCKSAQLVLSSKVSTATAQGSNANAIWNVTKPTSSASPERQEMAVVGGGPKPSGKPISRSRSAQLPSKMSPSAGIAFHGSNANAQWTATKPTASAVPPRLQKDGLSQSEQTDARSTTRGTEGKGSQRAISPRLKSDLSRNLAPQRVTKSTCSTIMAAAVPKRVSSPVPSGLDDGRDTPSDSPLTRRAIRRRLAGLDRAVVQQQQHETDSGPQRRLPQRAKSDLAVQRIRRLSPKKTSSGGDVPPPLGNHGDTPTDSPTNGKARTRTGSEAPESPQQRKSEDITTSIPRRKVPMRSKSYKGVREPTADKTGDISAFEKLIVANVDPAVTTSPTSVIKQPVVVAIKMNRDASLSSKRRKPGADATDDNLAVLLAARRQLDAAIEQKQREQGGLPDYDWKQGVASAMSQKLSTNR